MTRLSLGFSLLLLVSSAAWGSTFNYLGYGAANQGLANSTVALPTDAFSFAYNPSLMALQPKSLFSLGIQGVNTSFNDVNNIVVDTPSLGASAITMGNVSANGQGTILYALAYETAVSGGEHPVHLGVSLVAPFQRIFEIDTPDAFQPQYSLYSADTQRLAPALALAVALDDQWSVGLGGTIYLVQGTTSQQRLPSGGNATSRLSTDVEMGIAPTLGVTYQASSTLSTAFSYRGKQDYQSQIDINAQIGLLGASPLTFSNSSSLFYDPDTFLLGAALRDDASHDTYTAAAQFELWNGYHGGAVTMNFQSYTGSFSQTLPDTPFHNTLSLRAGFSHEFSTQVIRAGYGFIPTPAPDPNTYQNSNILDSTKHEIALGWGKKWNHFFMDGTLRLDLAGFFEYLVPVQVTKLNSQAVGYPGYTIGGFIYGYGLTLTREY